MIDYTQLVVRTDKATIEWLEQQCFKNCNTLPNNYKFPVFIVDLATKKFFGTNTTCMAAACAQGNRPIVLDYEQLKEKLKNNKTV